MAYPTEAADGPKTGEETTPSLPLALPDRNRSRVGRKRPRRTPFPGGRLGGGRTTAGFVQQTAARLADASNGQLYSQYAAGFTFCLGPIRIRSRTSNDRHSLLEPYAFPHAADMPSGCAVLLESSPPRSRNLTHRESTAERHECPNHRIQKRFTERHQWPLGHSPRLGVPYPLGESSWSASPSILAVTSSSNIVRRPMTRTCQPKHRPQMCR